MRLLRGATASALGRGACYDGGAGTPLSVKAIVAYFTVWSAIVLVALSPILQRIYIEHFWARGRGTVIRIDRAPGVESGWIWVPTIEYNVAGRRWVSRMAYWQRAGSFFGGPSSKYSVGDEVEILYDPRKPWRFTLPGLRTAIFATVFISVIIMILLGTAHNR